MWKYVVHTCKECGAKYSGSQKETSKCAQNKGLCKSCYGVSACAISTSTHIVPCATDAQRAEEKAENERATQSRTASQQYKSKKRRHVEQRITQLNASKRSEPASSGRATKQAATKKPKKTATATQRKKTPPPAPPLDEAAGPCRFAPFIPSPSGRGPQPKKSKKRAAESEPIPTAAARPATPDSPGPQCKTSTCRRGSKKARHNQKGLAELSPKKK